MVNPLEAYVRGVRSEHCELEAVARSLRGTLQEGEKGRWNKAARDKALDALHRLEDHLVHHFAHEEQGGYMEEALAVAPRFGPQASQLLRQHAVLKDSAAELYAAAKVGCETPEPWTLISEQAIELLKRLEAHEAAENRIMQEAFNVDLELTELSPGGETK